MIENHLRAFAELASLLLVSAKVNVAVFQVVVVKQFSTLRHDLFHQFLGRVKLVLEGCLLSL